MRLPGIIGLLTFSLSIGVPAVGHPGRLDAAGCHVNSRNGQSHCHAGNRSMRSRSVPRGFEGAYYRNCTAARAAGVTPIYRGQPGYARHLDRDGDGIACEPYRGR